MMIAANAALADEEEDMSDNEEAQPERLQEKVEQDAPGLSTRVSARATKGKLSQSAMGLMKKKTCN